MGIVVGVAVGVAVGIAVGIYCAQGDKKEGAARKKRTENGENRAKRLLYQYRSQYAADSRCVFVFFRFGVCYFFYGTCWCSTRQAVCASPAAPRHAHPP